MLFTWNKPLKIPSCNAFFRKTEDGPWGACGGNVSYRDTNVEPGVPHSYTVCCVSPDGKSMLSDFNKKGLSVTIPSGLYDPVQLQTPVLLDAQNVTNGVKLSWPSARRGREIRHFPPRGCGRLRGACGPLASGVYDESVKTGATTATGMLSPPRRADTPGALDTRTDQRHGLQKSLRQRRFLPAPVLLDAQNVSGAVKLSWQAVNGAAGYGVFRRTTVKPGEGLAIVTETSFTDTGTAPV